MKIGRFCQERKAQFGSLSEIVLRWRRIGRAARQAGPGENGGAMKAQVVSFRCILRNTLGEEISSSFHQHLLGMDGVEPAVLPGLVRELRGIKAGEKKRVHVRAEEAYGFYQQELVFRIPKRRVPESDNLQVGDELPGQSDDGSRMTFRIVGTEGKSFTLDANHPLAGEDLIFDVEATDVREATEEDVEKFVRPVPVLDSPPSSYLH